ncbi:DNA polymerase delta subunit 2 [Ixodes scapularis]
MKMPMAVDGKLTEVQFTRPSCDYLDRSDNFLLNDRTFNRQYASFYCARYKSMLPVLRQRAEQKWGKQKVQVTSLGDLVEDKRSVVVGTLFKVMELQPSILKEISEEHHVAPQPRRTHLTDNSDSLVLEDDRQRLPLSGNIDVAAHVTGIPVAVLGRVGDDGRFAVEDICYAGLLKQVPRPSLEADKYLVLVSGVGLVEGADDLLQLQLLVDYLSGFLGCDADQERASRVVRVVLAGNTLRQTVSTKDLARARFSMRKESSADSAATRLLDAFLLQLARSVHVDVMPGEADPSGALLPQQPLHQCLFPEASQRGTLRCVTNPYQFNLDKGIRVLGTSGQTVSDVRRFSNIDDPLDVLEKTLQWRHMAPTAPDTLSCYPFLDKDPFIVDACPHLYFVGNQDSYATRTFKGSEGQVVRLVSVPTFCTTSTCVWVNLRTLDCEPMTFDVAS